ncbi:4-alpha-N-acetylgalactosaminyltransferase [Komagataeibacter europaeus]|uniref:4-alpha-N-acetylgalactosaminyltransferase n=1 Tax=Komagataeibacter europaeus TaxID=33995 RepID=A0A0M0ECH0_KOMEU|nr:glycosyltransferase family 1 protein [Komagataeibacter europaeus]KON62949.1 4-alpha-N-acetylgalactosaminyltransferase [Komagataeibacter europaeus]
MIQNIKPTIWLDISDFMYYAEAGNISVSGIQRVIANLVIYRSLSNYNVVPIMLERHAQFIYNIDVNTFETLVEALQSGLHEKEYIQSLEAKVRKSISPAQVSSGDIFVMAGAFWVYDDYDFLKTLREKGLKIALFIHDLIQIRNPEYVARVATNRFEETFLDVLAEVTLLLTNSDFVRDDVKDYIQTRLNLNIPVESVKLPTELPKVNYDYKNIRKDLLEIAQENYVLYVSTIEIRKNHILLLKTWVKLLQDRNIKVPKLVFVGKWGWETDELEAYMETCNGLEKWLFIFNNISDEELSYLYKNCLLTAYTSFAEGWGLPVGESLAYGKACVASDTTSIPEVGGDYVEYIDPNNPKKTYEVFRSLFSDYGKIEKLEEKIKNNFKIRTWKNYCEEFYTCIDTHLETKAYISPEGNNVYSAGKIYFYGYDDVSEQSKKGGELVTARMTRVAGWHRLQEWGSWAAKPKAILHLPTKLPEGTKISIFIRIQAPPSPERMWLSCHGGAEDFVYGYVSTTPAFINFDGAVGKNGDIVISLDSTDVPPEDGAYPTVHVGISAIGFVLADDSNAYVKFLGKILNETPKKISTTIAQNSFENQQTSPLLFRLLLGKAENPEPGIGTFGKIFDKVSLFAARRSARKRKWAKAEKYYASILRRYINQPRTLLQYGHMLKEQGVYDVAVAAYRQVMKLDPENEEVRRHFSAAQHERKK